MDTHSFNNLIGYVGSAIILSSFMMTSTLKLRIINTIGAFFSITYSLLIGAYPTAVCNVCITAINLYHLWHLLRAHGAKYSVVSCQRNEAVLINFIEKHLADIHKYYPKFTIQDKAINFAHLIMAGDEIVGLQAGIRRGTALHISVDYSIPKYRDCSVGRYAYSHIGDERITKAYFSAPHYEEDNYLSKVGYVKDHGQLSLNLVHG